MNDDVLLSRIRDGDVTAEGELWERYLPRIRFFILRKIYGNSEAAADLEQEVFIALQRAIRTGRLSNPDNVGAYLYKTSLNQVLRWKERNRRIVPMIHPDISLSDENPETIRIDEELRLRLRNTVNELENVDRKIITLRFAEELSYRKIGEAIGISEGNARQRACRTIARLRKDIREG